GAEAIFQITPAFRKGESGPLHNPEFTLLEWYRVGDTYHEQMAFTEELVAGFLDCVRTLREGEAPWEGEAPAEPATRREGEAPAEPQPNPVAEAASFGDENRPSRQAGSLPHEGLGPVAGPSRPIPRLTYAAAFREAIDIDPH